MTKDPFEAVAAERRAPARQAIASIFGSSHIGEITRLSGGASTACTYRLETGGRKYLLRVEGEPSPLRNPHQYSAMRIAAEAGIAPKIYLVDEVARIAVIDFIDQRPLDEYPGGPRALAWSLGELISRVHCIGPFPYFIEYPNIVRRLFAHVQRTGLFAANQLGPHFERLDLLSSAYSAGAAETVSSHNDLIPSNILFDGQRLWLIDWESAYRSDPLVDVAISLDSVVRSPELEDVLLKAWLGRTPDAPLKQRLAIVRALTRLYYAGVFLSASAAANWTTADPDLGAPTIVELDQAIRTGQLRAGAPQTKHLLGKMYLASFMTGIATPGFDAAV